MVHHTLFQSLLFSCSVVSNSWTVARQAPLSMGFSRKEYWSGLAFLSPGDLPDPGIKPASPALAGEFFSLPLSHQGSSNLHNLNSVLGHISSFQPQNNPVRTPVHSQWDCKNWCSHYGNQYGDSLRKLKIELPYHSTIPVLGILKKKKTQTITRIDTFASQCSQQHYLQ